MSRAYDKAKQYYTLAGLPVDEVIRLAADRPGRFTVGEWEALLLVGGARYDDPVINNQ